MASSVIQSFSGVSRAARLSHRAARRIGGVYGMPNAPIPGSQCRAFQRVHIPMPKVCHRPGIFGPAPGQEAA